VAEFVYIDSENMSKDTNEYALCGKKVKTDESLLGLGRKIHWV
jgi:hypothetical protein